jgi:hypothetical protein
MPTHVLAVDLVALLFAVIGFHMAFRQRLVRRLWKAARPNRPTRPPRPQKEEGEDPVHYALIIFGMMLFAFGIILFSFTTLYALLT